MTKKYDLYDLDNSFTEFMIEGMEKFIKKNKYIDEYLKERIEELAGIMKDYRNGWDELYKKNGNKFSHEKEEEEYDKMMSLLKEVYRQLYI